MVWPLGLFRRLPDGSGAYRATGWMLRVAGVAGLLLLAVAVLYAVVAVSVLVGPDEGWAGLVAAAAILIALLGLVGGLALSVPPAIAFDRWWRREASAWPWVRGTAIGLGVLGATFWLSPLGLGDTTPLSRMLMVGRLVLLAFAVALYLVARKGRPGLTEAPSSAEG